MTSISIVKTTVKKTLSSMAEFPEPYGRRGRSGAAPFHLGGLHLKSTTALDKMASRIRFQPLRPGTEVRAERVLASECPEARRLGVVGPRFTLLRRPGR